MNNLFNWLKNQIGSNVLVGALVQAEVASVSHDSHDQIVRAFTIPQDAVKHISDHSGANYADCLTARDDFAQAAAKLVYVLSNAPKDAPVI